MLKKKLKILYDFFYQIIFLQVGHTSIVLKNYSSLQIRYSVF